MQLFRTWLNKFVSKRPVTKSLHTLQHLFKVIVSFVLICDQASTSLSFRKKSAGKAKRKFLIWSYLTSINSVCSLDICCVKQIFIRKYILVVNVRLRESWDPFLEIPGTCIFGPEMKSLFNHNLNNIGTGRGCIGNWYFYFFYSSTSTPIAVVICDSIQS